MTLKAFGIANPVTFKAHPDCIRELGAVHRRAENRERRELQFDTDGDDYADRAEWRARR